MALNWIINIANTITVANSAPTEFTKKETRQNMDSKELGFVMPLHYPRYTKDDYEKMEEWKIDVLLREYGFVNFQGTVDEKKRFVMGAFLWPDQV